MTEKRLNLPISILANQHSSVISSFIKDSSGKIYIITEKTVPQNFSHFSSLQDLKLKDIFQLISQIIEFSKDGQTSSVVFKESVIENGQVVNPEVSLSCSSERMKIEFTNISFMIYDKIFKRFEYTTLNKMLELINKCTDSDLKKQFTDILNRPENDPREQTVIAKYPDYAQYYTDREWMTVMLLREIYWHKDFDSRRVLSFLAQGDVISKKIEKHIQEAIQGDVPSAVKGLAEVMKTVREFTDGDFHKIKSQLMGN